MPTIDKANAYISTESNCQVDARTEPNRHVSDRSRPFFVDGKEVVLTIPVTGDLQLMKQPPRGPNGLSRNTELTVGSDCIEIAYKRALPFDTDQFNRDSENDLNAVAANIGFVVDNVDSFNRELLPFIESKLHARRKAMRLQQNALDGIRFPVRLKTSHAPASNSAPSAPQDTPKRKVITKKVIPRDEEYEFDVFICHASEEKMKSHDRWQTL